MLRLAAVQWEVIPELSGGSASPLCTVWRRFAADRCGGDGAFCILAEPRQPGDPDAGHLGNRALSQVFSGALIMATMHNEEVYVFSALGHTLLISALFGVLCYLSVRVWQKSRNAAGS